MNYTLGAEVYVTCDPAHYPNLQRQRCTILEIAPTGIKVSWEDEDPDPIWCYFLNHTIEVV